ncbi:nucleoporin complex subunit 54-domain-containing protein [Phascolomyces articulosus]|uniref:Nucleoporin complex subunit 54-domain-containing protein n=1 Tax=Phascolomyces articulosus TaxID=60185 RepID=A0AAD5JNI2_9FUNG|nr:nucleoporin complex subunit 54-domain-containing protein [Phascolomyces articulosus]
MSFSFGAPAAATSQPAGGFSFNNSATATPAPAATTSGFGGGFGATSAPTTSTAAAPTTLGGFGGFGQPATSTTATPSLFGNTAMNKPAATSTATTGFGGFGTTSNSLFNTNKPATTGGLGTGLGGFSSSLGGGFGGGFGGAGTAMNQQQRDRQVWQLLLQIDEEARRQQATLLSSGEQYKPQNIWQALALLKSWWDPQSPYCRFKHYFYNVVPSEHVHLYQKPPNHDKKAWDDAQKKNPDPSRLVPALAIGFEDVKKRMEAQEKQALAQISILKETEAKINKLRNTDALATAKKLEEYKTRHMELTQRVIWLLKKAQVLRNKGLPMTPEEEEMRATLENIQEQLLRSEQFHGKLSQLWAQLQLIKESGRKYGKLDDVHGWNSVSGDDMNSITKILEEQQTGIQHTMDILDTDQNDVDNMINHYRLHN